MSFKRLLSDTVSADPAEQQRLAAQRFPEEAQARGIRLWRPGDQFASTGVRFLLGVAAGYSIHDLELLDNLESWIRQGRLRTVALDVFDMSQVAKMEEFEAYIPGIAPVRTGPILGVWVDGLLTERLQGFYAKQRLLEVLPRGDSPSL